MIKRFVPPCGSASITPLASMSGGQLTRCSSFFSSTLVSADDVMWLHVGTCCCSDHVISQLSSNGIQRRTRTRVSDPIKFSHLFKWRALPAARCRWSSISPSPKRNKVFDNVSSSLVRTSRNSTDNRSEITGSCTRLTAQPKRKTTVARSVHFSVGLAAYSQPSLACATVILAACSGGRAASYFLIDVTSHERSLRLNVHWMRRNNKGYITC